MPNREGPLKVYSTKPATEGLFNRESLLQAQISCPILIFTDRKENVYTKASV